MYVPLDRDSSEPLSRQIAGYLEELLRRGHIAPGGRLPSLRAFARELHVARETIETAYGDLAARGLVHVVPGQGAIVRRSLPDSRELALPFPESRARDPLPAHAWRDSAPTAGPPLDLAGRGPALLHSKFSAIRRAAHDALDAKGTLLGAPPPGGEMSLRQAASRVFAIAGVLRPPEEIAVFHDAKGAVGAVLEAFVPEGGVVLAMGPVEPKFARAIREAGGRLVLVDADASIESLRRRIDRTRARLVSIPSEHDLFPRVSFGLERRRALLDVLREAGLPVLEDVTRSAAPREEQDPPPLSVLDRSGRIIALVDLGDEVGAGFEGIALAASSKAIERFRVRREDSSSPFDRLAGRVLAARIDAPERARVRRAAYEKRALVADAVVQGIRRRLSELRGFEIATSLRGARLDLPEGLSGAKVAELAREKGVLVVAAAECGVREDDFLLLDLTREEEGEILEGIRRLGEAIRAAQESSPPRERARENESARP